MFFGHRSGGFPTPNLSQFVKGPRQECSHRFFAIPELPGNLAVLEGLEPEKNYLPFPLR
jgi:hypothetical protein